MQSDYVFTRIDGTPIKSFNKAWWASLKDVKEKIGHKDIAMTDRYSHLTLAHKLQQQRHLADHYTNRVPGVGNK